MRMQQSLLVFTLNKTYETIMVDVNAYAYY